MANLIQIAKSSNKWTSSDLTAYNTIQSKEEVFRGIAEPPLDDIDLLLIKLIKTRANSSSDVSSTRPARLIPSGHLLGPGPRRDDDLTSFTRRSSLYRAGRHAPVHAYETYMGL